MKKNILWVHILPYVIISIDKGYCEWLKNSRIYRPFKGALNDCPRSGWTAKTYGMTMKYRNNTTKPVCLVAFPSVPVHLFLLSTQPDSNGLLIGRHLQTVQNQKWLGLQSLENPNKFCRFSKWTSLEKKNPMKMMIKLWLMFLRTWLFFNARDDAHLPERGVRRVKQQETGAECEETFQMKGASEELVSALPPRLKGSLCLLSGSRETS